MAPELVRCKHCGFKFRIDLKELVKESKTPLIRGLLDFLKKAPKNYDYVDIQCRKCGRWFEAKVE